MCEAAAAAARGEDGALAIGLMSGTSLDGIDLCAARFRVQSHARAASHDIVACECVPLSAAWKRRLREAFDRCDAILADSGAEAVRSSAFVRDLDEDFGALLGETARDFVARRVPGGAAAVDLIGSHGHTILHAPGHPHRLTLQIGSGARIATMTGILTVSNFRERDVAEGGQGAPLVPIGDLMLFAPQGFRQCLNLGGIANVCACDERRGTDAVEAYDICCVNMVSPRDPPSLPPTQPNARQSKHHACRG